MQSYAGFDSTNHLGADGGVMDVCADFDAGEDGDNVEGEGVTHCIYGHSVNPCSKNRVEEAATDEQIRDKFGDSLPGQVHRSEALPEHGKLWPCGIIDKISRGEEHEVQ